MSGNYHHGDLRRALVDVAIEMIDRDGLSSFSLAEACRRLNVSPGAPYRHFHDRHDLLEEIAMRAIAVLGTHVTVSPASHPDPLDRLARSVSGYVIFAARHPALFEVIFSKEVLIGANSKMREVIRPLVEAFVLPTYQLPGISDQIAGSIIVAAAAIAHGFGIFVGVGNFATVDDAISVAAESAAQAVRALVLGPDAFSAAPNGSAIILAGRSYQTWIEDLGFPATT